MSFSTFEASRQATSVTFTNDSFVVRLRDGHDINTSLESYPRLLYATPEEREDWELIDDGLGIHWEAIDEDISVAGLVAGRRSGESARSFARWLDARELVNV